MSQLAAMRWTITERWWSYWGREGWYWFAPVRKLRGFVLGVDATPKGTGQPGQDITEGR